SYSLIVLHFNLNITVMSSVIRSYYLKGRHTHMCYSVLQKMKQKIYAQQITCSSITSYAQYTNSNFTMLYTCKTEQHTRPACVSINYRNTICIANLIVNILNTYPEGLTKMYCRNNALISNFRSGFRCNSEYPWCIIEFKSKNIPKAFKKFLMSRRMTYCTAEHLTIRKILSGVMNVLMLQCCVFFLCMCTRERVEIMLQFQTLWVISDSKMNLVGALKRSFFELPNSFQKRREKQKKN
ncbi:Uncharacterized protein FWK35_00020532, partial [Aphis craccivora]